MRCTGCFSSGACDACDGYGCYPDSFPGAGDGPECEMCSGDGQCPECFGTGETTNDNNSAIQEVGA